MHDHSDQAVFQPQVVAVEAEAETQFALAGLLGLDLHENSPSVAGRSTRQISACTTARLAADHRSKVTLQSQDSRFQYTENL
jgi:hypothetical protein